MNVQGKNLNVARKLNDETVNLNVKKQTQDKMRKVECKMQH